MDHAEGVANRVMERLIAGAVMEYRPDQSAGQYDFDLVFPEGTREPVEVTASVDERRERAVAAIFNPRKGGAFVQTRRCGNDWLVHAPASANINRIKAQTDNYLADIEDAGLTRFFSARDAEENPSVERIYGDLGVKAGGLAKGRPPGRICIITTPGGGGVVGTQHLHLAVEAEAAKEANRRKLSGVRATRRRLFVYVHPGNFLRWIALIDLEPPEAGPRLPAEVDVLWAATETCSPTTYVVWQATRASGWVYYGTVEGAV